MTGLVACSPAACRPFAYRDGILHAEAVPLDRIADRIGTPVYVYAQSAIEAEFAAYRRAFAGLDATICYAVKANSNQAVIAALAALGAGADVVSEGELRRALAAGVPPDRIVFAGVGKTAVDMAAALDAGILQVNVESEPELALLSEIAVGRGTTAPVAVRVNPDVAAGTHAKITTGTAENKFGIAIDRARRVFAQAAALPGLRPVSVAVHIGSQMMDLAPYRSAFARVADLVRDLAADGIPIARLDLGGGLGIGYQADPPSIDAYAGIVRETVASLGLPLVLEPGRRLVGAAGVLLARCVHLKRSRPEDPDSRRFIILDAAMNDLIRPTLYEAHHDILTVRQPADAVRYPADVVGPVCESGDTFARDRLMPPVAAGDLVAVSDAGAYGAVMSGTYNSRPLVPEVMVRGGEVAVIRPRQTLDDLIALDRQPPWQAGADPGEAAIRAAD